jgi:quercetin dioxygenase-like cupin family protein
MKPIFLENADIMPNPHQLDAKNLFDSHKTNIVHITLKPGDAIPKHSMPMDVLFYVLEGKGTFFLGDEAFQIKKDCLLESPSNIEKGWKNDSDGVLRLLAIKMK